VVAGLPLILQLVLVAYLTLACLAAVMGPSSSDTDECN